MHKPSIPVHTVLFLQTILTGMPKASHKAYMSSFLNLNNVRNCSSIVHQFLTYDKLMILCRHPYMKAVKGHHHLPAMQATS